MYSFSFNYEHAGDFSHAKLHMSLGSPGAIALQAAWQILQAIPDGLMPSELNIAFTFRTTGDDKLGNFIIIIFNFKRKNIYFNRFLLKDDAYNLR